MLAQSNSSGVKMNTGTDVRKPLRARKTMTPSSRRQIKMLKKAKEGAETMPNGASNQDKDLCVINSDVNQFLNIGALQDILYSWYETESSSPLCKPVEVHLNGKPAAWTSDSLEARFSSSPPAVDTPTSSTEINTGRMVLEQESPDFRFHEKNTTASMLDNHQRKRTSENSNGSFCKRKRTSEEAREGCQRSSYQRQPGLGKIKGFIQEQLVGSMRTLDHQLQHLHERIDHMQCLRKHEGMAMKIVVNLPGASSQNKILNRTTTLPDNKSSRLRPPEEVPSGPRKMPPETTKERSDDVICLDEVNTNPVVAAVNPPGVHQKETPTSTDVSAATPSTSKAVAQRGGLQGGAIQPEKIRTQALPGLSYSHQISSLKSASVSPQAGEDFSHLPPLPKTHLHPEPVTGFQGTLPPQKLELSVVRVENPKGIALRWNVQRADPHCAPLESFHLFLFLEGGLTKSWQETNQIQAKKLPMACTATSFPESTRIYLAMRAKDIYGRYGPFSDIQSVHDPAEESEGKSDPGQDVGIAVLAAFHFEEVVMVALVDLLTAAEELEDEDEKSYAAENGGQDHRGLDGLD
ncbi:hypothetical protein JD844_020108 [Phrynosoma platyrhinos]|uniref:Activating transcription factor 7-interacting protein Fn3 domain-containing protein n=1 Tax=Phrynosoma platyrhinos TaxID=52577 RepID=A0ABQ7TQG7_PHRPL|nr:hypothetical protein JD844_020108 [Phrynosoma platyrhinos]